MKKVIGIYILFSTILFTLHSCEKCDLINYYYPVEVKNTITQNIVPLGESFEISLSIPNLIEPTDGVVQNIEDDEFNIDVIFQKFVSGELDDSKKPYAFYENAIQDLDIEVVDGEVLHSSLQFSTLVIKPKINPANRNLKILVTPLKRDTFIMHFAHMSWDSNRENKNCADLNKIKFENNSQDLPTYITEEFDEVEENLIERFPNLIRNIFSDYDGGTFCVVK